MVKKFMCGLCNEDERFAMTRYGLRKHLREIHFIKREITNTESLKESGGKLKRSWWIEKKF